MKSIQLKYVPFFRHNDPTRMQMASSHIRQATILTNSEYPMIKSKDCPSLGYPFIIKGKKILHVFHDGVIVEYDDKYIDFIPFYSCLYESYMPYQVDETSAQASAIADDGTPLLGTNLLTVVMPFGGYNYEDAIVISETAAEKLAHWSWDFDEIYLKEGWGLLPVHDKKDEYGIPIFDIKKIEKNRPYCRIFRGRLLDIKDIISDKTYLLHWDINTRQASLIVEFNAFIRKKQKEQQELLTKLKKYTMSLRCKKRLVKVNNYDIGILKIASEQAVVGDKLANRHGNKGVVGLVLPNDKMPQTPYGPAEIVINPLGIISRMNIGQLFELHLTKLLEDSKRDNNNDVLEALEKLVNYNGRYMLDTISWPEMKELFAKLGKRPVENVYDPIAGMTKEASVGWMYWLKLHHLAKTKYAVRQFSGHKGQRFGEMETWALFAYGAEDLLNELFSKLSDSPAKSKLFSQLLGFSLPIEKGRSSASLKFEAYMKVLGIDIIKAFEQSKK